MELHDPAELGMSAARLADATALMDRQFAEGLTPTAVALVARHGKVVWTHTVGDARPGGPPVTIDSVFPMASQTKPMTAAVIMALAERGLIGLTESASLTLPELAGAHEEVMVFHLLTHTSGWNEEDQVAAREANLDEAIATIPEGTDALTHILLWPGWGVPRRLGAGERMQYCNFNYSLLGEIVRRVTGGTLDAARDRILDDEEGGAVLDRLAGVEELGLAEDLAAGRLARGAQPDQGRAADGIGKVAGKAHGALLRVLGPF